ncbi:hypothetical protein SNEBB_009582, partial [Seison nebaliae]
MRKDVSIEEMIQPFKGTCRFIQYNPMKPIWSMAYASNGYIHKFSVYIGKENKDLYNNLGLGERVVLDLVANYTNLNVYTDSFFPSIRLAEKLLSKGNNFSGTINFRKNNFPFSKKAVKERGAWLMEKVNGVNCFAWMDKKEIFLISTEVDAGNHSFVGRKNHQGRPVQVPCPQAVVDYNNKIGGVDHSDQLRSYHHCKRKSKKWYFPLVYYLIDIRIQAELNFLSKLTNVQLSKVLINVKPAIGETNLNDDIFRKYRATITDISNNVSL